MSRVVKSKKLDSRTARRAIVQGKVTHWISISRGRALGYRRGKKGGSWVARFDAENFRREQKLGEADDVGDSDGVQILDFAQARKKADQFFDSALTQATGESPTGPRGYTVADAIREYLKHLEHRVSADYANAKYDLTAYVLPHLGSIQVLKLNRPRLEQWRSTIANSPRRSQKKIRDGEVAEPPKPLTDEQQRRRRSTTNRLMRRVKAALNLAVDLSRVNANPINWRIKPFENVESARAEFLTEAQQRTFITACGAEPDFQNLVLAALHTGCRLSELARLRVRDFVAAARMIYVEKSKSGKPRPVLLDEETVRFCKRMVSNRGSNEAIFLRKNGKDWTKDAVKKPMRRACNKAGIPRLGFHQLRHSFATRLLTQEIPMKIVAQQLGHTSVRMLEKHYGHLLDSHVHKVIAALPSAGLNDAAKAKRGEVSVLPSRERSA